MNDMEETKKIIDESGNGFHCRVLNEFRSKGWNTLVSPYYLDEISNKPREIDLVAEKEFEYNDNFSSKYGTINVKLFIECKYITQKVVFWFDNKDIISARKWVLSNTSLLDNNVLTDQHSYLTKNLMVAKLFSSKTKQNPENEPIYKAINQSLNAMVYLRSRGSIIPPIPKRHSNILTTFSYPIIICNSFDNFYRVEMLNQDNPHKIDDNFQLEVNYAYMDSNKNNKNEFFQIDVIDFNKLDSYLGIIDSDVNTIKKIL